MPPRPDPRLARLLGIEHPLLLAPMAGAADEALAIAVARAGGLGSLPCAMLDADTLRAQVTRFRTAIEAPINLNFFCHVEPLPDTVREARWRERLAPYYDALGVPRDTQAPAAQRRPFDEQACATVESLRPEVVSFHFGLPAPELLARVKACGARVLGSATTVAEARWLAAHGCDAIIAQGWEAGGHRGSFLDAPVATQPGLLALLPQVVDAVDRPVIAAGGIGDARGIRAALALGAAGVQLGTAFLLSDEARIRPLHRAALASARAAQTAVTNLFSGRPARGIANRLMRELGPMCDDVPAFPSAGSALAPLRQRTEPDGIDDFVNLWAGEAAPLAQTGPAEAIARALIDAFPPSG
ncbi:1-(5-phosphoribosyl)-5-[(5-phosphoribosylamino)methylideneamino]imidazole-4-carboxamide isomerase [Dyella thiooxydans]|uniref:Nitronate monooxygenase n=1 Tax=Dyella thiooxydans TaxID=445710 RepID=A0A160MXC5_9GAMM|nr:nitronate monooxygenase [Dyella thiooxydans]AND67903.1 1-(5-phosphoribosyl)-5-[(5-phosphoribosylamino)methylideneamino]imidazole-4-carboxamide isomerase [Dyella thiooxydans]